MLRVRGQRKNKMVKKDKACLNCKLIFEGERCPICNESITTENWKGRVFIFNSKDSEVAKNMKLKTKGEFAIKTK